MNRAAITSLSCIAAFLTFTCPLQQAGASDHQSAEAPGTAQKKSPLQEMKALAASGDADGLYIASAALKPESMSSDDREAAAVILIEAAEMRSSDPAMALGLAEISLKFSKSKRGYVTAADMAASLGDPSLAGHFFDGALKFSPDDDAIRMKRAATAAAAGDWNTAEAMYKSIPENSSFRQAAEAGLKLLADDRLKADKESEERAHRDLLRRIAAADNMIDAMPVSEFDFCRAHTLAACEAVTACRKIQVNCTFLLESCPKSSKTVAIPRPELSKCADALAAIPCDKLEPSIPKYSSDVCRGLLLRTTKSLVPEDGEKQDGTGTDEKGKSKKDTERIPSDSSQLNPGEIEAAVKKMQEAGLLGR